MFSLYITLYDIGDSRFCHWALAATKDGVSLTEPVHLYQIVTNAFGAEQKSIEDVEDGYIAKHDVVTLAEVDTFICAIRLPHLRYDTLLELDEFMAAQPVGRRGSPLIDTPTGSWDCFQWAMRTLKALIDSNVVVPESDRSVFTPKAAAVQKYWGPMIGLAGTKCARAVQADRSAADVTSGIPVISLESSGVIL